jgi:hypothetical protein
MIKLRNIIMFTSLLIVSSCAIGPPQAEPGALGAANPQQWRRIGIMLAQGSNFYSDPIKIPYPAAPGTSGITPYIVPVPNAGKPPKELAMAFARQIEKETGVDTIALKRPTKKVSWDERLREYEKDNIDALVTVFVDAEGTYFPSSHTAESSLTIYVHIIEVPTGKRLWDNKQRNSDPSGESSLARRMSSWSYAPFSYGVYHHSETGVVDYSSQFNSTMFIGAYDSAMQHVPRIVADLVTDMDASQ